MVNLSKIDTLITDVEGCLVPANAQEAWELDMLSRLGRYNSQNENYSSLSITMCTGREKGFVEALSRFIDCHIPVVFENGCGLYLPSQNVRGEVLFHPKISPWEEIRGERAEIESTIANSEELSDYSLTKAIGKEVLLSYYSPKELEIDKFHQIIQGLLQERFSNFQVTHSVHTLDIFPQGIDKGAGVSWLVEKVRKDNMNLGKIAAIGDSRGDLPFLTSDKVSFSAAPANAIPQVKKVVDYVSPEREIEGVLDIINYTT